MQAFIDYKSAYYKIQVDDEAGSQIFLMIVNRIIPQYSEILEKQEDMVPFRSKAQQTTEDEKIKGRGQLPFPEFLTSLVYAV